MNIIQTSPPSGGKGVCDSRKPRSPSVHSLPSCTFVYFPEAIEPALPCISLLIFETRGLATRYPESVCLAFPHFQIFHELATIPNLSAPGPQSRGPALTLPARWPINSPLPVAHDDAMHQMRASVRWLALLVPRTGGAWSVYGFRVLASLRRNLRSNWDRRTVLIQTASTARNCEQPWKR